MNLIAIFVISYIGYVSHPIYHKMDHCFPLPGHSFSHSLPIHRTLKMRNDEGGGCLDRRQDRGIMTKRMLTAIMLLSTPAPPDNAGYTGKGNLIEPPPPPLLVA